RWSDLAAAIDASAGDELAVQDSLRRRYPAEQVRAAFTLHDLRRRFASKFGPDGPRWYDRVPAEQATPAAVATYKASRFRSAGDGPVYDLCCGIGSDTLGLAAGGEVIAVDCDPLTARMTGWNVADARLGDRVEVIVEQAESTPVDGGLLHIDPDRRTGAGRSRRVEDYRPGLDALHGLMRRARGGAVKLGPASNFGGKFDEVGVPVTTELVSLDGECKEATVWFGELAEDAPSAAAVLPAGTRLTGDPLSDLADRAALGRYLFDPDPAVVRAGLVDRLGEVAGLARLDEAEEYLTSDACEDSPFATAFEVIDEVPNNERAVRAAVRSLGVASVEIKCRHLRVDADAVRRRLPLGGDGSAVLIYARIAGRARVVLARRVDRGLTPPA
ncbi:MAG: class I SAM-dependent methyltransferase, partial [Planctomycetota bacterium]